MERNIVIFGPAKAGKSTLLGYIYANRTQGFNLEKADSDNRKKLEDNYEEKSKYSYIFDTLPDEVLRGHGRGTTRTMKMKKIRINDCEMILIDTPGAEHHYRERVKGMYYGEIGVFMVELLDLTRFGLLDQTNENAIKEFFTPLCLWYGFKDKRRKTIVAISKMDTGPNPFSKKEFNKATKIIKTISQDETIEIIPISIIVGEDCDHNVLRKSEKLGWYSGPTLLDRLREVIEETPTDEIDEPLFSHINKKHAIPGVGGVMTVKILQGTLIKGSVL
jgi:sulfate adenylyltransferase subunit 1